MVSEHIHMLWFNFTLGLSFIFLCFKLIMIIHYPEKKSNKLLSNSPGLVNFAIGLVNFVLNLPDWHAKFFEEFKLKKNCEINSAHQNIFGLVEMTFGLAYASFSLPE